MVSALVNGVKGGKWFSLIDKVFAPATLDAAWAKVTGQRGGSGGGWAEPGAVRGTGGDLSGRAVGWVAGGKLPPAAGQRVEIPKGDGETRPLGIPAVKDRIVQAAMKLVIEPIFEVQFRPTSYGFRPGRGCQDALREVDRLIKEGYTQWWTPTFRLLRQHSARALMRRVEERISDGRILGLLRRWLDGHPAGLRAMDADAGHAARSGDQPAVGEHLSAPAGRAHGGLGNRMVRYADDFVVLCRSREEAEAALAEVRLGDGQPA